MIETAKYARKPFEVEGVQLTEHNFDEVLEWTGGERKEQHNPEGGEPQAYIKVKTSFPMNNKQSMAFVGDWVLKSPNGFKVYTQKAFNKSFEAAPEEKPPVTLEESIAANDGVDVTAPISDGVVVEEEAVPSFPGADESVDAGADETVDAGAERSDDLAEASGEVDGSSETSWPDSVITENQTVDAVNLEDLPGEDVVLVETETSQTLSDEQLYADGILGTGEESYLPKADEAQAATTVQLCMHCGNTEEDHDYVTVSCNNFEVAS